MWICLQTLKRWPPLKTELREGEEIKERMNSGQYTDIHFWNLCQEVSCERQQEEQLHSDQLKCSPSFTAGDLRPQSLSECWNTNYQWFNAHLFSSALSSVAKITYMRAGSREWNEIGIAQKLVVIPLRITTPVLKTAVDFHHFSEKLHSFSASPWRIVSNLSDSVSHYIWLWKYYLTISFPERLSN